MSAIMEVASKSPVGMKCPPMTGKIGKTTVRLIQGDLTALPVEAWVYYAREDLAIGSGFGTAIQMRGGQAVKKALAEIGKVAMGDAVVTTAGEMKADKIIHACGPKFQEPDLESKLRKCMASALSRAKEHGIKTLAFPPMGTGFYGVPLDLSARVMCESLDFFLKSDNPLEEVVVCVLDYREYLPFAKAMEKYCKE